MLTDSVRQVIRSFVWGMAAFWSWAHQYAVGEESHKGHSLAKALAHENRPLYAPWH